MTHLRLILIEDHDLTRIGLRLALQQVKEIEIIAEATTGKEGLKVLLTTQADVALVDIGLPDLDGIELTRQFKQAQAKKQSNTPKIVILTMQDHEESVLAAFAAGADAYCMKDIRIERLVEALQTTIEGNSWIDPAIAKVVLRRLRQPLAPSASAEKQVSISAVEPAMKQVIADAELTVRELEILQLIVAGYSNLAIAQRLSISLGTVKTHVRNILNKLCADDRTQAAVLALRSGLVN